MAERYDSASGQIVDVADMPDAAALVSVQNPTTGAFENVSKKAASALVAQGWKLDTPELRKELALQEKYGEGLGNEAAAGALGLARGMTFGLSDLALAKTGAVSSEALRELAKRNPDATLAGEVGSFLLPAAGAIKALGTAGKVARGAGALVEGASAVGRGVEAAGTAAARALGVRGTTLAGQVVGHMLPRAAGIAAEAELFNLGHNLSQAVMKDQELTAEALLANSDNALMLGGALGIGGPLALRAGKAMVDRVAPHLGELAKSVAGKAVSGAVKKVAEFFDPDRSLQLFSGLKSNTPKQFPAAVRHARDAGFYRPGEVRFDPQSLTFKQISKGALPDRDAAVQRLTDGLDDIGRAMDDMLRAGDGQQFSQKVSRFGLEDAKRMSEMLTDWRKNRVISDVEADRLGALVNDIGAAVTEKGGNLRGLHELRQGLDQRIGGKNWETLKGEEIETVKELRRIVSEKIDQGMAELEVRGVVKNGADWKKLNKLYGSLKQIQAPIEKSIQQRDAWVNVAGLRWRDLMLSGVGAPVGAAVGDFVAGEEGAKIGGILGGALGVGNKLFQTERGLLWRAQIGERLGALAGANNALAGVSARLGAVAARVAKLEAPRGLTVRAPAALQMALTDEREHQRELAAARDRQDRYRVMRSKLNEITADPMKTAERIGRALNGAEHLSPAIKDTIVTRQMQAYAFLESKAPKDPLAEYALNPAASKYEPPEGEIATWERYVRAAQSPMSVFDDLAKGDVTPEAAETLRVLYPRLYARAQTEIMGAVMEAKKPLPYDERVQLGIMFDIPTDPSLAPDFAAAIAERASAAEPPPAAAGTRMAGADKMSAANLGTRSETLAR